MHKITLVPGTHDLRTLQPWPDTHVAPVVNRSMQVPVQSVLLPHPCESRQNAPDLPSGWQAPVQSVVLGQPSAP